jgi:hemerythrin superfamily protein
MLSERLSSNVDELLAEDHKSLDNLLSELLAALDRGDAAEGFTLLDLFWARLGMHIRAENLHLFPSITVSATRGGGSPAETLKAVDQLRRDHNFFMKELSVAIEILRASRIGGAQSQIRKVAEIIRKLSERLDAHNELEEQIVYLLPARLLAPEEQSRLVARIRRELENLPPRFSAALT